VQSAIDDRTATTSAYATQLTFAAGVFGDDRIQAWGSWARATRISCRTCPGSGLDAAFNTDLDLEAIRADGYGSAYTHSWKETMSSSVSYGLIKINPDDDMIIDPSLPEKTQYFSVNWAWQFSERAMFGVEYLWGQNNDLAAPRVMRNASRQRCATTSIPELLTPAPRSRRGSRRTDMSMNDPWILYVTSDPPDQGSVSKLSARKRLGRRRVSSTGLEGRQRRHSCRTAWSARAPRRPTRRWRSTGTWAKPRRWPRQPVLAIIRADPGKVAAHPIFLLTRDINTPRLALGRRQRGTRIHQSCRRDA
jgi:hypothetical protein